MPEQKKDIFRHGIDIFTVEGPEGHRTARLLKPTEFERDFASQSYNVNDLGQRPDLFSQYFPDTSTPPSGNAGTVNDISQGTDELRGDNMATQNQSNQLLDELSSFENLSGEITGILENYQPYGQTEEGQQGLNDLVSLRKSLGLFSDDEMRQIDEAGETAGARFLPLIQEAEEQRRQGRGKAAVGAGEVGGFMNTQFAGIAALVSTEGGTFEGEGGRLNEIKSAYDRNISNLKAQQQAAISQAKAAAREALRTGKYQNYQIASDAFDKARGLHNDAIALANDKIGLITNLQTLNQRQKEFEASQDGQVVKEAQDRLNFYLDNFGVDYVENNKEEITQLFSAAGYKEADIDTMVGIMREKADAASRIQPKLQNVGGDLYMVEFNDDGTVKGTSLVIKGRSTGSGTTPPNGSTEDRMAIHADIQGIRGTDGYVDTAKFKQIREQVAVDAPELLSWFDKTYSANTGVLNPNDPTARILFPTAGERGGEIPEEENATFLTEDFFKSQFTEDQLKSAAKDAGISSIFKTKGTEIDEYLEYLMGIVDQWRKAGYSDKEILESMQ